MAPGEPLATRMGRRFLVLAATVAVATLLLTSGSMWRVAPEAVVQRHGRQCLAGFERKGAHCACPARTACDARGGGLICERRRRNCGASLVSPADPSAPPVRVVRGKDGAPGETEEVTVGLGEETDPAWMLNCVLVNVTPGYLLTVIEPLTVREGVSADRSTHNHLGPGIHQNPLPRRNDKHRRNGHSTCPLSSRDNPRSKPKMTIRVERWQPGIECAPITDYPPTKVALVKPYPGRMSPSKAAELAVFNRSAFVEDFDPVHGRASLILPHELAPAPALERYRLPRRGSRAPQPVVTAGDVPTAACVPLAYPSQDCSRVLVLRVRDSGFGSLVNSVLGFAAAAVQVRLPFAVWSWPHGCFNATISTRWDCFFVPPTTCEQSAPPSAFLETGAAVVRRAALSCGELDGLCNATNVDKPRLALARAVLQPTLRVQAIVAELKRLSGLPDGAPYIAAHVRSGDKTMSHTPADFAQAVALLRTRDVKHVFLATDNHDLVAPAFEKMAAEQGLTLCVMPRIKELEHDVMLRLFGSTVADHFHRPSALGDHGFSQSLYLQAPSGVRFAETCLFWTDLELMKSGSLFVGSFRSHVARLVRDLTDLPKSRVRSFDPGEGLQANLNLACPHTFAASC